MLFDFRHVFRSFKFKLYLTPTISKTMSVWKPKYTYISAKNVAEMIKTQEMGKDFVIVDVRDDDFKVIRVPIYLNLNVLTKVDDNFFLGREYQGLFSSSFTRISRQRCRISG
jgi:uncharacterized 2Fe-2S/4Fe-4S cluster protein (DUF4445 family)